VEVREALDVEHVHLINKEDAWDELGRALFDVPVDDLVDLAAELVRDLRLLGLHELAHHRHEVLPALGPSVGLVEVVERHVLDDLPLLVDVALGQPDVFLRLQVILAGIRVAAAQPLDCARVCLDVDHIADLHLLADQRLVHAWIELQLLRPLARLEPQHDMAYCR
jgi:hypothetical protein